MKFNKAATKVEKMARIIIKEHFPNLKHIKILYVMRAKPKPGEDDTIIAGTARVLPAKMVDIYGFNAEIELAKPVWDAMDAKQKRRLLWHELRHLQVEVGDDDEPILDKDGRISVHCDSHDISMKTFSDELRLFGLQSSDIKVLRTLAKIYRAYKKGKIKKIKPFKMDEVEVDLG